LFAMLKYGERIDADDVPSRVRAMAAARCGNDDVSLFFPEPKASTGGTMRSFTKRAPNAARKWPGTVQGKERTYRKKIENVMNGDDQAAKDWLSYMTLAWLQPALIAIKIRTGNAVMFRDVLKMTARRLAREAGEEEEQYAIDVILPAIDIAIPVK
jgi:hypothetical protein